MPFVPEDGMNGAQGYGNILNIIPLNRQQIISPVADEHKTVFGVIPYNTPHHLMGKPPDAVVRHRPEGARVNGNNHIRLPYLNYKCGN